MFNKIINTNSKIFVAIVTLLLLVGVSLSIFNYANAATVLTSRTLKISNSGINENNVKYTLGYELVNPYVIGSVVLEFCANSPLLFLPCDPIPGFDASGALILDQTGILGYTIAPGSTSSRLILSRIPANEGPITASIEFGGITNPSVVGNYYGRVQTFSSTDGTGAAVEEGGTVFQINTPLDINTEVPPYLYLCVAASITGYTCDTATGSYVNFGEFSRTSTKTGTSQFIVATNAGSGFVVSVIGNPPTSGNNVIPNLASQTGSATGQSQFGMNLRANSNPSVGTEPVGIGTGVITAAYNTPNQFRYNSGDSVVTSNTTSSDRKFTVSYIVNVNASQRPGIYNTTILYNALATF